MTALAPNPILGPVMRSFDVQLKMPRVLGQVDEGYLSLSSNYLAQTKHQRVCTHASSYAENASRKESYPCRYLPISVSVEAHGVDDRDEGLHVTFGRHEFYILTSSDDTVNEKKNAFETGSTGRPPRPPGVTYGGFSRPRGHRIMANPQPDPCVVSSCLALLEQNNHGRTVFSCRWLSGYVHYTSSSFFRCISNTLVLGRPCPKVATRSSFLTDTSVESSPRRTPARTAASLFVSRGGWPTRVPLPPVKKRARFGGENRDGDA
jgi:hypothetical protein